MHCNAAVCKTKITKYENITPVHSIIMHYFLNLILSLQFHQHKPAERCSVNSSTSFAYRNTWEIQYCRKHVRVKFHLLEIFQKPIILTRSSQKWYIALHIRLTYKQMVQRHCCFWQNSVLLFICFYC